MQATNVRGRGNSFALDARSANGDYQITRPTKGAFMWLI
jgi:hypothetical protein